MAEHPKRNCRPRVEPLEDRRVLTAQFSVNIMDVPEGDGMLVEILLSEIGEQMTAVTATVQGVSATAGTDYAAINPGVITFAPWEMRATFEIETIADVTPETDEEIRVTLSNPVNAELHPTLYVASGLILNDDFNFAPRADTVPDKFEWAERPEPWTLALWDVFSDNNDPDPSLTYEISVGAGVVTSHAIDPATGIATFYFDVGEAGIANVTVRATDPYGAYDEALFDIIRVVVEDYEVEVKDQGVWTPTAVDLALLDDDELRWRANFYPITPPDIDRIDWIYKSWDDAADDQTLEDVLAGSWELGFTSGTTGVPEDGWFEWTPPAGDWRIAPRIHFVDTFAMPYFGPPEAVYTIEAPFWVGHVERDAQGNILDEGNTNFESGNGASSGDRIFAERSDPTGRPGSALHEHVDLRVSLDRMLMDGKKRTIGLKLLDPDFPSDVFDPLPEDGSVDSAPNDNANVVPGTVGATFPVTSVTIDSAAVFPDNMMATVTMTINARQPTNNFRVAAFNSKRFNAANFVIGDDGTTIKHATIFHLLVPQSPLLTVWRHVYIEQDSMTTPNLQQGPNPSHIPIGTISSVYGAEYQLLILEGVTLSNNQFQGGQITLLNSEGASLGQYTIDINSDTVIRLAGAGNAAAVAFRDLYDDDHSHNVGVQEMMPGVSGLASRLLPACIEVVTTRTDLAVDESIDVNNVGSVPFDLNVDTTADEEADIYSTWRLSVRSNDFWTVYVVGAFQGALGLDNDGDSELVTRGISSVDGSIVFRESIRDSHGSPLESWVLSEPELWQAVAIHELAHQLGITGPDEHDIEMGTIMHYESLHSEAFVDLQFGALGYKRMIINPVPGTGLP